MKRFCLPLFTLLFFVNLVSTAQKTLMGVIVDDSKVAIRGASVYIKGTRSGTITDSLGFFKLVVPDLPVTLVCSMLAFNTVDYVVTEKNGSSRLYIKMNSSTSALDEVVVVGYATHLRKDVTGAVAGLSVPHSAGYSPVARSEIRKTMAKLPAASSPVEVLQHVTRPGLLTAAEVSDFKKWKLWSDYNTNEFSQHSRNWMMSYVQRYCVLAQNPDHTAIPGEKIYLVNASTNDTAWAAVTDNTGKAELWGAANQQYRIVSSYQKIDHPTLFAEGINRLRVARPCGVSNKVNIAFVVDATGSMGDEIRYLQQELKSVINGTADKYKDVNLKIASVFYRDRGDEYLTRLTGFEQDVSVVSEFMNRQAAGGGGDGPEAVEEALATALDSLNWDAEAYTKLIFLVLDAPPHNEAATKMQVLIRRSAKMGVRIVPVVCSGIDKSTEYLMRCIALATNGTYITLTDDSGIGNEHIKPTTDEYKVELLNDLLQRLIGEMIYVPACNAPLSNPYVKDTSKRNFDIRLFPNPTKGPVTITCSDIIKEAFITDFTGKILFKVAPGGKNNTIKSDLSNYPSGTYLFKYYIENKGWGTEKISLLH